MVVMPDEHDDLPPPELLDRLPPAEDGSERFAAAGWAGIMPSPFEVEWDSPSGGNKPEMVKQDNEDAYRQGMRER